MLKKKQTTQSKGLPLLIGTLFLSLLLTGCVSAVTYSTFTLRMVDVLKICIIISGLFIIVKVGQSYFRGERTFGELFRIGVVVGLGVGVILLLAPVLINYISNLIN